MSCSLITTGRNAAGACKVIGGIETVYIANSDLISGYSISGSGTTEAIDDIATVAGATGIFYEFKQIQETSGFTATPNANIQNGSLFFETILTLVFTNYNASLRYVIKTLAENNLVAIAKMKTGEYVLLGQSAGLDVSGGEGGSGVSAGDRNGASLTFRGIEANPPAVLDPTFVASTDWTDLINPAVA
jgi:hypothetical protein